MLLNRFKSLFKPSKEKVSHNHFVMISAGEVSGDLHAAHLMTELKKELPCITFWGMGGEKSREAGAITVCDLTQHASIGLIEPLIHIFPILKAMSKLKQLLKRKKPCLLIAIDFQGFNMSLIKKAKKYGVPVIYYISPQEWQWGSEKGGKKVVQYTDKILSIFPQEHAFYRYLNGKTTYIGHPLLDIVKPSISASEFRKIYHLNKDQQVIGLFPGSRSQELKYTAPIILQAAALLHRQYPDSKLILSVANTSYLNQLKKLLQIHHLTNVTLYTGNPYDLIANVSMSIVASGTITLEHAILEKPCVVVYKFSKISYWFIRTFLGKRLDARVKYMSLPNFILQKNVLPEFLQTEAQPLKIYQKAVDLLSDDTLYNAIINDLKTLKKTLGSKGVITKAAKEIAEFLKST